MVQADSTGTFAREGAVAVLGSDQRGTEETGKCDDTGDSHDRYVFKSRNVSEGSGDIYSEDSLKRRLKVNMERLRGAK